MKYVTADLHLNHKRIIQHCHRPFTSVEDMNTQLVASWNDVVHPGDEVYVLGDFAFTASFLQPVDELFHLLHGQKYLIVGNHDQKNSKVLRLPWVKVYDLHTLKWEQHRFILCHYPLESWKHAQRGYLHLHGHCHGTLKRVIPHRFDVGVDVEGYAPVPVSAYVQRAAEQAFDTQDHYGLDDM